MCLTWPRTIKRSVLWWMASNMVWKFRLVNYPSPSIYCHFHLQCASSATSRMFYRDVTWQRSILSDSWGHTVTHRLPWFFKEYDVPATSLRWLWCFQLYICLHFHLYIHGKDVSFNPFMACWTCIRRTMLPRTFVTWSVQGLFSVWLCGVGDEWSVPTVIGSRRSQKVSKLRVYWVWCLLYFKTSA